MSRLLLAAALVLFPAPGRAGPAMAGLEAAAKAAGNGRPELYFDHAKPGEPAWYSFAEPFPADASGTPGPRAVIRCAEPDANPCQRRTYLREASAMKAWIGNGLARVARCEGLGACLGETLGIASANVFRAAGFFSYGALAGVGTVPFLNTVGVFGGIALGLVAGLALFSVTVAAALARGLATALKR